MTKILLVEDDKSLREIYGVRLLAEGYDIVSAGDGEQALAMAIKERPNLIVSDVMMPKISGFDMLDILRSTTETRDIKVIMMTALSSEDQRARGEQLGADRYLVKSQVGIEDVVRTVHEVLADQGTVSPPQAQPIPSTQQQSSQSVSATQPAPQAQPQTVPQQPAESQPSSLPQPTAPFSSQRPPTLGERIIHPLESAAPTASESISNQIAQELQNDATPAVQSQPAPQPQAQQQPQPQATSPQPTAFAAPPVSPTAQPAPTPQSQPAPQVPPQQPQDPNTDQ